MNELENPQEHAPITRGPGGKWLPGRSPNPAGKPRGKTLASELRRTLTAPKRRALVEKIVSMALSGDPTAQRIVWDRHDGPLRQALDLSTADTPQPGESASMFFQRLKARLAESVARHFPEFDLQAAETMRVVIEDSEETINTN